MRIGVGDAAGKFVEVELAKQDGASGLQLGPYGGIESGDEIGKDFGAGGGANALGIAEGL